MKPKVAHCRNRARTGGQERHIWTPWVSGCVIVGALVWSYWPTLIPLLGDWRNDANYSVGQLVPFAAIYLLWNDRRLLSKCSLKPCWWGAFFVLLAQAVRAFGVIFLYESIERYSLAMTISGLVLFVAGWRVFRQVFWILTFLFLMVPLPGRVHNLISGPLQSLAAMLAAYALELIGVTVTREGNAMTLNGDIPIAVAEACSGLRMLTAFVVVACVMAYVVNRSRAQKIVLVLSSIPVAIVCNLVRLVVTSILFLVTSSEMAERFFHDFAGLTMMPLAVLLLVAELTIMSWLTIKETEA